MSCGTSILRIAFASFLLLLVLVVVQACVSLSKEECAKGDWLSVGEKDGARGLHPEEQFKFHVFSCKRAKVMPDYTSWYKGFQQGLLRYCTPLSGLHYGQLSKRYYNLCPADTERDFLRGYNLGRKQSGYEYDISTSKLKIENLKSEIWKLEDALSTAKPEDERELNWQIIDKGNEVQSETRDIEENSEKLSEVEFLVERFKQNPKLEYDLNIL